MRNLPYIDLAGELHLNTGIVICILSTLSHSKRGNAILNHDRLQLYYFLISRPAILNKVLVAAEKHGTQLRDSEIFSVESISVNVDNLYDRDKLRLLLQQISVLGFLDCTFSESLGICYSLTEEGIKTASKLTEGYFEHLKRHCLDIQRIQAMPTSKINSLLNHVFKERR